MRSPHVIFSDPHVPGLPERNTSKNKLLLNFTKTIKKYQINSGGPLTFTQVLRHPRRDELLAAWNVSGGELESLRSMACFGPLDIDPSNIPKGHIIPSKLISIIRLLN